MPDCRRCVSPTAWETNHFKFDWEQMWSKGSFSITLKHPLGPLSTWLASCCHALSCAVMRCRALSCGVCGVIRCHAVCALFRTRITLWPSSGQPLSTLSERTSRGFTASSGRASSRAPAWPSRRPSTRTGLWRRRMGGR